MRTRLALSLSLVTALLVALPGCPHPESDTVSARIGPEGGTLSHPSGAFLVVPPGALSEPVSLTMTRAEAPSAEELHGTPLGSAFVLGPEGQGFARPVELTLPFDAARAPTGASAPRIFTAPRGSHAFVLLESSATASSVTAATLHFSTFVAAAPFAASVLSITTGSPLTPGAVSAAYGPEYIQAIGGTPPYSWLLSWGALPQGISLATAADGRGVLQGVPGNAGNHSFTLRVSDASGQVTERPFELSIAAASGISISGVVPSQIPIRSGDTLVTVTGTGFDVGSVVTLEGASLATTFVSNTSLTAIVPASALTTAGSLRLQVSNALLSGGVSNAFSLLVTNGLPVLTSMSPAQVPAGHPTMTVTLTGSELGVGAQAYLGTVALPTQVLSPTQAVITVNANLLVNAGTFPLTLVNPAPGGGTSAPLPFRVVTLAPPTVLAPGVSDTNPTEGRLTVDDVSVYWSDRTHGTVSRVPIAGGPVTVLDSPGATANMRGLVVGDCTLYWLRGGNSLIGVRGQIMSEPVSAGGGPPGTVSSPPGELNVLRYDAVNRQLLWSTGPDVADSIFRIPASGGTPEQLVSGTWIQDFQLDDSAIYFVSRGTGRGNFYDGGVYRVARDGGFAGWLAINQNDPRLLAVSTDRVYWALASGEILSVAKTGVGGVSTVLRTGETVRSLAVDASYLYWTTDHDVRALPLGGGPAVILASMPNTWPHALAVDGAFLYWLNRSAQVLRLAKPGGSGGPPATSACAGNPGQQFPTQLSNVGAVGGLVSDGSFLFYSNGAGSGQGAIFKLPLSGGVPTTIASGQDQPSILRLYNGQLYWPNSYQGIMTMPASGATPATRLWAWGGLEDLAVDSSGVWWVSAATQQLVHNGQVVSSYPNDGPTALVLDTNDVYTSRFATAISRQPKSGGPSTQVVNDNASPASMVISGGYLYWVSLDGGIKRVPLAGGPIEVLATGQSRARSLVVDGTDLYWVTDGVYPDYENGRVKFLRGGVGTPVTLAEAQPVPSSILVDAQYVYWLNGGTSKTPGGIMRLAKSALP